MKDMVNAAFELKAANEEGVFEGYASVFNLEDDGADVVQRGAFTASLKARGPQDIKLLWQHDPAQPIGVLETIREDARGLYVKGRLLLDVARAREALSLMRSGALDGLSIGYRVKKARQNKTRGVRLLDEVELWEVSLVTFPMQQQARIHAFKSAPATHIREFEAFLRDAGGFSRREAKALAAHGFRALSRRDDVENWASVIQSIHNLTDKIKECSYEPDHSTC